MPNSIHFKEKNGVGEIVFDLPNEKVNILKESVLLEFDKKLDELKKLKLKALLIKSAKENIFIAGADITEIKNINTEAEALKKVSQGQSILNKLSNLNFPTIAVIDGVCLGGGLELALACNFRVATDNPNTKIGLPEVNLGIIPGFGGTQRLPKLIGYAKALSLILTGKSISGTKAYKLRVVDACYPRGYLMFKLPRFIELAMRSPEAIIKKRKISALMTWLDNFFLSRKIVTHLTKKQLLRKTGGHYPAPLTALTVMMKTHDSNLEKGLKIEAKFFAKMATTEVSKNLIHLFETSQKAKKDFGLKKTVKSKTRHEVIKSTAVLGAGVMGGGIAWLFSKMDLSVRMKDVHWQALLRGLKQAGKIYRQLKKIGRYDQREIDNKMSRISIGLDHSGFNNVDLVVEAVVEDLNIKKKVLRELEANVSKKTIIASNTSSLSITEMSKSLKRPEHFIGLHFFNPVNRMPLVEIIPGEKTSSQTIATTVALAKKTGKTPIVVKDKAGFLVNRLLLPYMNEAGFLLQAGGNPQTIDKAICHFAMPMGPFTLLDEVGLDVGYKVALTLEKHFGPRMKVCPLFEKLYHDKKSLGKKSGRGIYLHQGKNKVINPEIVTMLNGNINKNISNKEIIKHCLYIMINEASRCLEENIVESPQYLDLAMVMGAGFPPFRGGLLKYADTIGVSQIFFDLKKLYEMHGERFKPSDYLEKMAKDDLKFYQ